MWKNVRSFFFRYTVFTTNNFNFSFSKNIFYLKAKILGFLSFFQFFFCSICVIVKPNVEENKTKNKYFANLNLLNFNVLIIFTVVFFYFIISP